MLGTESEASEAEEPGVPVLWDAEEPKSMTVKVEVKSEDTH